MKLMRVALLAVSTLLLPGAIAASHAHTSWTRFQTPGDGYSIDFPGAPTVTRDTLPSRVGPAPHVSAAMTNEGYSYSVELTTFASASPPDAVLDLFGRAFDSGGKVRTRTRLKVGADQATLTVVEVGDGKFILTALMVTDGTRVYQVWCTSLRGQETSASVTRFINSFRLVPP